MQANPPESVQTDISLSQFLAIQEKGVSAWEFEPELEIANCFVEGRTEIEFFDSECSVQSNLPIPKQNEVYYWEAKVYEKPENTSLAIGVTTKPYPLFRLPGAPIIMPHHASSPVSRSNISQATTSRRYRTCPMETAATTSPSSLLPTDLPMSRETSLALDTDLEPEPSSSPATARNSTTSHTASRRKTSSLR